MPSSKAKEKKESGNDNRRRIESILARLTRGGRSRGDGRRRKRPTTDERSSSSQFPPPPPDEVSSALGRSLASAYAFAYFPPQLASPQSPLVREGDDEEAEEVGGAIVDVLSSRSCSSGSVANSFFDSLASESSSSASTPPSRERLVRLLDVWSGWLVRLEERIDLASTLRGGGRDDDDDEDGSPTPDAVAASEAMGACIGGFVRVALRLSRLEAETVGSAGDVGGGGTGGTTPGGEGGRFPASAYGRMRSASFRRLLLSYAASGSVVGCGGDDDGGGIVEGGGGVASWFLTPLLVRCLLHPAVAIEEKRHCVTCVVRQCRLRLSTASTMPAAAVGGVVKKVIRCLINLLILYVRMNALSRGEVRGDADELVLDWCTDLTELVLAIVTATGSSTSSTDNVKTGARASSEPSSPAQFDFDGIGFVEEMASDVLPSLVASPLALGCVRRPLRPLLLLLRDVVDRCHRHSCSRTRARHEMTVFRLSLCALNSPVEGDVSAMLTLLSSLVDLVDSSSFDRTSCEVVGTIMSASSGPGCSAESRRLLTLVDRSRSASVDGRGVVGASEAAEVPLLFRPSSCTEDQPLNAATLVEMLDSILPSTPGGGDDGDGGEDGSHGLPSFAASATQVALTHLVSSCLLCQDTADVVRDAGFRLTGRIASKLPHLSVRLYPVLLRLLRRATTGDSDYHSEDEDEDADDYEEDRAELAPRILKLLAGPMSATNPHVATQVFNLLSKWITDPHAPTPLRSTSIRILPLLCRTNRRTFRRVSDLLKSEMLLRSKIREVCVSTAASIADLCTYQPDGAAEELLSVLQGVLLVSDDPLVVSFGITSLHHLVESGRLDFDVTIKVLRKRMKFDVADVDEIMGQDEEVVRTLVVLFGDGAIEDDGSGSSSDGDDGDGTPPRPSPQVASAVRVLWGILSRATSGAAVGTLAGADDGTASPSTPRVPASVRARAYRSLAGYDAGTLGIDGEVIRSSVGSVGGVGGDDSGGASSTGDDDGYSRAVALLVDCLRLETDLSPSPPSPREDDGDEEDDEVEDGDRPLPQLERLIRSVVGAEYDALGSTLWTKPESRNAAATAASSSSAVRGSRTSDPSPSKAALTALPTEERIRSMYEDDPSSASATSLLFAFRIPSPPTIESIDDAMTLISDLSCDLRNDDHDLGLKSDRPLMRMVTLSAWVHAMRKVWWAALSVGDDNFDYAADRIVESLNDLAAAADDDGGDGADNAHLAMAASALVLSERRSAGGNEGGAMVPTLISSLRDRVAEAVRGRLFDSEEVANLCTSLLALSSINAQDAGGLEDAVDILLGSLDGDEEGVGGGAGSFSGAVIGLGLVAEGLAGGASMAASGTGSDRTTTTARILRRVTSRLVEELTRCTSVRRDPVVSGLGPMILTGKPTPDLVTHLTSLSPDDVQVNADATERFRTCCAGVGFAMPALARFVHMDFVLALYRLLTAVPWGYGKGYYALPSAYRTCVDAGLLSRQERESFFAQLREESNSSSSDFNEPSDDAAMALGSLARGMREELGREGGSSPTASRRGEILSRLQGYVSAGSEGAEAVASMALCPAIGIVTAIAPASVDGGSGTTTTFASPPRLWTESTRADVKSTVSVLNEVLVEKKQGLFDGRSIAAATLTLGILSCMKSPPPAGGGGGEVRQGDDHSARSPDSSNVVGNNRFTRGRRVDFRSFPRAREGSLTRHVVERIERCYHHHSDDASKAMMPTLLRCIGGEVVSLPGQFSRLFYSLLSDGGPSSSSKSTWSRDVRYECLRAISSQVECSHGDNVRDFVNVTVDISRLPPVSFRSLLDDAGLQTAYLQSLRHGLSRFPSGYVEGGIRNLWDGCCGILLNGEGVVAVETIMIVLSDVVKFSRERQRSVKAGSGKEKKTKMRGGAADMLPPIAVRSIQTTIVTKIFPSLVAMVRAPGMQHVRVEEGDEGAPERFEVGFTDACKLWDAFLRCLDVVPLVRLEEAGFFVFGEECTELRTLSSTLCRAFGTMHMVGTGAFDSIPDRMQLEVAKVRTWLSRQHLIDNSSSSSSVEGVAEAQIHSMRLLAVEVASATGVSSKSTTVRRDAIQRSFEIIQVTDGSSPMCLEQLAFDTSHWCQDIASAAVPGLRQARERSEVMSSYSSLLVVRQGAAAFIGVPRITAAAAGELASLCLTDLPLNVGTVCCDLSMSETISRRALQQAAKSDVGESGADDRCRKERCHVDDSSFAQMVFYCYSKKGHGFEPLASLATSLTHEAAFLR